MKQILIHVGLTWQVEKLDKSLTKICCQVVLSSEKEQVFEWEWRGMELTMVTCSFRQSQSVQGSPL